MEYPAVLVTVIALAWLLQATADRLLELAWGVRAFLLCLDLAVALALLWFFVIVPFRMRMDRKKAALFVERTIPQFKTALISAVELSEHSSDHPQASQSLVGKLLEDTTRQAQKADVVRKVIQTKRIKYFASCAAATVVLALACSIYAWKSSPALLSRILLANTPLPHDTNVVSMSGDLTVIMGAEATLTARAGGKIPANGNLIVKSANGLSETITVSASRLDEGVFQYQVTNVREPFTYQFKLNDGTGPSHRVKVLIPPALDEIKLVQNYPKYTNLKEESMSASRLRLLEGSKLGIEATASEPLQSAVLVIDGEDQAIPLKISGASNSGIKGEVTVPGEKWKSMFIRLVSANGKYSANEPIYQVEIIKDLPPTVQFLQPKKDSITVVAGAKTPFSFKTGDDFGLKGVFLIYQILRPGLNGILEPAERGKIPVQFDSKEKSITHTIQWDLSRLVPAVGIGCHIRCWVEAEDYNPKKDASVTRSAEKEVEIVSEEQKHMELLELLGERAKDIDKLYELQRGMNEKTDDSLR
ncbi:MAG: hypothetical protein H8M99_12330 [Gloeobacteraceae cyanobacterium ES-bin-144]|nr:hypothetical protein [Verrucomicrobiales bacterium]